MKLINTVLLCGFVLLSSCSQMREPVAIPTATAIAKPVDTSSMLTAKAEQSTYSIYWQPTISKAENLWSTSNIKSYEVVGRMSSAWQTYSFQVDVIDGKIVSSKCETGYDDLANDGWCKTVFDANDHTVPALFRRARELIQFADELAELQKECFSAFFDLNTGVPEEISFDCPNVKDEDEEWMIIFFQYVQ